MPPQQKKSPQESRGVIWALFGSLMWGTSFIVTRYLLVHNAIDPMSMACARYVGGGAIMLVWGLSSYGWELFPSPKDLLPLALLGLFGMAGMSTFQFFGQQITTAINSAIIQEVMPVLFNIVIAFFLGEVLTSFHVVGLGTSLLGPLFVTGALTLGGLNFATQHFRGDLLVFGGAMCWVIYSLIGRGVVERLGSFRTTTWAIVFGGLEMLLILQFQPHSFINWPVAWPWLAYLAIFPTAVAYLAWYKGMERIDWALLNIIQCLTPVFTIVFARFVLGESLTWLKAIGAVLVVFGIVIAGHTPGSTESKVQLE